MDLKDKVIEAAKAHFEEQGFVFGKEQTLEEIPWLAKRDPVYLPNFLRKPGAKFVTNTIRIKPNGFTFVEAQVMVKPILSNGTYGCELTIAKENIQTSWSFGN